MARRLFEHVWRAAQIGIATPALGEHDDAVRAWLDESETADAPGGAEPG
jgi:hypothetical protein